MKPDAHAFSRSTFKLSAFLFLLISIFPALSFSQGCTANFTAKPTSGCTPLEVEYSDASSGAVAWNWVFSGGIPSSATGKGPHKVVYHSAGTYDAALSISCKAGTDTEYKKGFINATACCTAGFSASPTKACPGQEITFTDASVGAVSWSWHFNGATPSYIEGRGPHKVVYNTIGTYDVSLEIKCASTGDMEYKKALIQIVSCSCEADFSASQTSGAAPLSVVFSDRSTNAVNWLWSFPGGSPSSMQGRGPHTVVYNNPGDYNVSLQVFCANGQDVLQRQGYIHVEAVSLPGDYGDAPEGAVAYPSSGVIGAFPTCRSSGTAGYIRHTGNKGSFLGNKVDHEADGNAGSCSAGSAYDQDELCYEADSGLWAPDAFTLRDSSGVLQVAPLCAEFAGTALGEPCETAVWGRNINLYYNTDHVDGGAYINVLIDWNQDGAWGGSSVCTSAATPRYTDEHVLKNFPVPGGTGGHLSTLRPADFVIGPNAGYVWARLTITETPVSLPWNGSGEFNEGESEDYLLKIAQEIPLFDYGDAPFGSRLADNGARHRMYQGVHLGATIDPEEDGQADAQASGDDRNGQDDEDGVQFLNDWIAGDTAHVEVTSSVGGMLKAWVDFNRDKDWDDKGEMVLDTQLAAGKNSLRILIPEDAKEDSTFARFRFSLQPVSGPGGLVADGEVEDYRILIRVYHYDYGDAPRPFPTTRLDSGARHLISPLYFGSAVDREANGTPSAQCDADDNSGIDDEDGIQFIPPFVPGYHFDYTLSLSAPGYVTAWIDFNNDGDWDDDWEQIQVGRTLLEPRTDHPGMPYSFSAYIPPGAALNKVAARFRISSTPRLPFTGPAGDGEVEDYLFPVGAGMDSLDWGDAPDPPYPTLSSHDGPRHIISARVGFGIVDKDRDGMPSLLADGDDLDGSDDENHYRFITPLVRGHNARIEFWPRDNSILNGWIDFNADGDWDDPFEHCIQDLAVTNPGHPDTATFKVPLSTVNGYSYARFRISKDAGIGYTGLAVFGSVEDYRVLLGRSSLCERDSLALVALYRSTNGDSWANRGNWLRGPLSTWYGVELDGCRVRAIRLPKNNLTGVLPPEIGYLDAMEILDLSTVTFADSFPNTISGGLPAELGRCSALVDLNLSNNHFSGSIPAALGNLPQLLILQLQGNELTGVIPAELGNLSRLQNLSLNRNALEGEIPGALCGLANLRELYLSNNQLTGTIPGEIGRLSNLRLLVLGSNQLSGPLPASLYTLANLTHLGLYDNGFTGSLSADIGNLASLISLFLHENRFEGGLPEELYGLSQLQQLRLNSNRFSGVISPSIRSLRELQFLGLEENDFSGAVPDAMAELANIKMVNVHGNQFTHFPDLSALTSLETLQLQNNRLTFADIEPNMSVATRYYSYAPQDSLGIERDTTLTAGTPFELHAMVGGTANVYQWQRNGADIPDAHSATLRIPSVAAEHIGRYSCRITSSIAVDLTLYTRPVHLFISGVTAVPEPPSRQPDCYRLEQNHPNPFNPETRIEYQLPQPSPVWLGVYNLQGQCVRVLVNEVQDAGIKQVVWDARSDDGKKLSSGIYIYRLEASEYRAVRKMVLLQ